MPLNEVNEPIYEKNDVIKINAAAEKKETRHKEENVLMSSIYVTDGLFE